jgi:hypothetical protein
MKQFQNNLLGGDWVNSSLTWCKELIVKLPQTLSKFEQHVMQTHSENISETYDVIKGVLPKKHLEL